eukprot:5411453-Pyramimonas_sp.AAC.1
MDVGCPVRRRVPALAPEERRVNAAFPTPNVELADPRPDPRPQAQQAYRPATLVRRGLRDEDEHRRPQRWHQGLPLPLVKDVGEPGQQGLRHLLQRAR